MNLQLFAYQKVKLVDDGGGGGKKKETQKTVTYDPNSVVDYLKQQGQDSSYSARQQIAKELNIQGYEGSGSQNKQMLNMLRNGTASKPTTTATATPTAGNTAKPTNTPAPAVETVAPAVAEPVAPATADISGVGADTMQALNTPYAMSSAVQEAWNVTNAMREKLSSGRTSYTDQIQSLMNQIQNRDKFSYDVDTDVLFQQALASAMGSGQQAMRDTIGQASALTGGYASSYATSAGNQAYNAYIQDAYNNLPEYYQMALDAYNMEGQEMYNQLSMLSDADATEYGRMYDAYSTSYTEAQDMYNREYGEWQDSVNNAYNVANLQNSDYWSGMDESYRRDALQQEADQFEADDTYRHEALAQDNYWNEQDNIYRNNALAQDSYWNEQDRIYRNNALAQENDQFIARYDLNGDGVVNNLDNAVEEEEASYKEPTETQKQKALEAYNTGGEDEYWKYLDSLPSTVNVEAIDLYVMGNGAETNGYGMLPEEKRTYTKTKDTTNWLWGTDKNDIVVDQYGNEYRIDALPESLRKALTKLKQGESYTAK